MSSLIQQRATTFYPCAVAFTIFAATVLLSLVSATGACAGPQTGPDRTTTVSAAQLVQPHLIKFEEELTLGTGDRLVAKCPKRGVGGGGGGGGRSIPGGGGGSRGWSGTSVIGTAISLGSGFPGFPGGIPFSDDGTKKIEDNFRDIDELTKTSPGGGGSSPTGTPQIKADPSTPTPSAKDLLDGSSPMTSPPGGSQTTPSLTPGEHTMYDPATGTIGKYQVREDGSVEKIRDLEVGERFKDGAGDERIYDGAGSGRLASEAADEKDWLGYSEKYGTGRQQIWDRDKEAWHGTKGSFEGGLQKGWERGDAMRQTMDKMISQLPPDERRDAQEFVDRQISGGDYYSSDPAKQEKIHDVAQAINDKLQGRYEGEGAQQEEAAASAQLGEDLSKAGAYGLAGGVAGGAIQMAGPAVAGSLPTGAEAMQTAGQILEGLAYVH